MDHQTPEKPKASSDDAYSPPFSPSTPPPPPPLPSDARVDLAAGLTRAATATSTTPSPVGLPAPSGGESSPLRADLQSKLSENTMGGQDTPVEKDIDDIERSREEYDSPLLDDEDGGMMGGADETDDGGNDQQQPQDDDDDAPEWEDFMAQYWQIPNDSQTALSPSSHTTNSTNNSNRSQFQIHPHAQTILQREDTDLKPCPIEPELDVEPYLSPIRTGCIDIDMDELHDDATTAMSGGGSSVMSPIRELSNVGEESARIFAKLGGGEIGVEEVCIATPFKRKKGRQPQHQMKQMQRAQQQQHSVASITPPRIDPPQPVKRVSISRDTNNRNISAQDLKFLPNARSFDTKSDTLQSDKSFDALDRKSTTSNTNTNKSTASDKNSPLPDPTQIYSIGPIMTRTSLRSLVMKKWSPSWWMHYGPHTLLIFRSKDHLDDWRDNPYHGTKQREYLVKLRIDFYGEMVKEEKEGGVLGHRALPVKKKNYGKNDPDM